MFPVTDFPKINQINSIKKNSYKLSNSNVTTNFRANTPTENYLYTVYTTLTGTYGFYFHQHGGWFRYIHNFSCFLNHILFFFFTSQSAHFKRKIIKTTKTKIKMNITKIIPCMQRLCMRFFFFFLTVRTRRLLHKKMLCQLAFTINRHALVQNHCDAGVAGGM